jgi:CubicO group peptidase (beta-lactamase class C family)
MPMTMHGVLARGATLGGVLLWASVQAVAAIPQALALPTEVTASAKALDGYAGRYQLGPNFFIYITHEGDHLFALGAGQLGVALFPSGDKEFFAKTAPLRVTFVTDTQGKATALVLHKGGRDIEAKLVVTSTAEAMMARSAEVDALIAAEYARFPMGSVTVGVVFGKDLIWTKSYGNADMENKVPADKDTVYRIGSITKMFTVVMLEQLADAGTVHLSDAAEKYLPEVNTVKYRREWAPPVTLFELATHTSGLAREPNDMENYVHGAAVDWEKTLIAALPHAYYQFEPGTHFLYSNIGYATLGAALSRAAGQPYLEYVPKQILEPLGMTHTTLVYRPEMLTHLAKGYQMGPGGKVDSETPMRESLDGRGYKIPNGAIYTTVGDLAKFVSFLLGQGPESVLKRSSLEDYLTQSVVEADSQLKIGYGLGGIVLHRSGYTAFGHDGAVAGYQAGMYLNRSEGVGVIVLANELGPGTLDSDDTALRALDILSRP